MILTKDNIVLVDNEIHFVSKEEIYINDYTWNNYRIQRWEDNFSLLGKRKVTHSTNHSLEGVKHLDRNLFVKKVDVKMLAEKESFPLQVASAYETRYWEEGFINGYNAKEGEFTLEKLRHVICLAHWMAKNSYDIKETLKIIEKEMLTLSIPESIELDDEFNVVNVKW